MRKRLNALAENAAAAAGHALRNATGVAGAAAAVVGTVQLTGETGAGWLVAAVFLLIRDVTS
jgi:hypothetical protein